MKIIKEKELKEVFNDKIEYFNEKIKKELESTLKKLTGISFNIKAFKARNADSILIKDDTNIVTKIGAFGACLDEIYISGDCWFNDVTDEASGSMDFTYTSKSGGSNGLTLIKFFIEDGKLLFTDAARKKIQS